MTLLWTWGNCTEAPAGQADPEVLVQGAPQEASLTYSTSGSAAGVSFTGGPWATQVWLPRSRFLEQVKCSWVDLLTRI